MGRKSKESAAVEPVEDQKEKKTGVNWDEIPAYVSRVWVNPETQAVYYKVTKGADEISRPKEKTATGATNLTE